LSFWKRRRVPGRRSGPAAITRHMWRMWRHL
jgi:hypothetical protein